jgi:hypothetical protein
MGGKRLVLTVYGQNHLRSDWQVDLSGPPFQAFCQSLAAELQRFGIDFSATYNPEFTIDIKSYADLLNVVRISSPADGLANRCVGHVIGKSEHLDLLEDIRRAVNRVAFAPETIPPDEHNRRVCHNCGCGC